MSVEAWGSTTSSKLSSKCWTKIKILAPKNGVAYFAERR
jgi:hypothetical protein